MIPPSESLLKYENAVLVSKSTDRKSPKGRPLRVSPQQPADSSPVPQPPKPKSASADATKQENDEILNAILPPREWMEGNQLWVQQVSSAPCTRADVIRLEELLDIKMQQRQARQTGICPVRRELFSQCFDELIRQVTINCAERGLLLLRVRDEIQMTMAAYQTLYESSVAFGMRKALQAEQGKDDMERRISELGDEKQELKKQLNEEKAKSDSIEKRENEKRQVEEKKHSEEIQFLKRTNQQLKVWFINTTRKAPSLDLTRIVAVLPVFRIDIFLSI
ncbi:axonemal dynein light intermediate polypeptide 1 isoform X1 [Notothenia coriiceps]|uniref:Axonemal dynein light intermediate polypeptide 1 n=1 Tax=Notothenia coriiceps TaxID=8208 RepID=A0A6I9MQ41_9TELE|nr:PREDICTED: axonemal dynein light intermediate polypeptide 1 isoform X1 [Notothenia coriiceps]XP_010765372.1 PREDICTED: axonemal dynein light intermediate polypeptide 1 isoform X1 [Notothenia coriiceps]XP_010765373.1 PREDICTED: axonemal dynein light intermediate polypeptide 1 isoform X1 [Notothenia coriiceps]XP_010765374.1 PREDICTED: axonemal dynein light intermediate polypeptide 1 isoform X1 [Notothenia coriiceps]